MLSWQYRTYYQELQVQIKSKLYEYTKLLYRKRNETYNIVLVQIGLDVLKIGCFLQIF